MSVIPILGQKRNANNQPEIKLQRTDVATVEAGIVTVYAFQGWPLQMYAHRGGCNVGWNGQMLPPLSVPGVLNLVGLWSKLVRQHLHLRSFPLGDKQSLLTEEALALPEMQGFPPPVGAAVQTACSGKFHTITDEDDTCACGRIVRAHPAEVPDGDHV